MVAIRGLALAMAASVLVATQAVPEKVPTAEAVHSFTGCWESEDKLFREVWIEDPSGWLIGYALDREQDNAVLFFEHMRIEQTEDGVETLVVTGVGDSDSVRFVRDPEAIDMHRFVNAEHDYPQVIAYRPTPFRLDAEISKLDGSDRREFKKRRCE
ncbi:MAG: DUF6265 family protein [Pseudomonadota bacterium]